MINNDITIYKRFENFTNESSKICISITNRISLIFRNIIRMASSIVLNTKNWILMWPRDNSFRHAVRNQDQAKAINLLALGPIFQRTRYDYIITAATSGRLDILNALLANGPISETTRGSAVVNASRHGHLEVVKALLAKGSTSVVSRGDAFEEAARNGHSAVVNELLANGPISVDSRNLAFWIATRNGYLDIVNVLLANGHPISGVQRGHAVMFAARNGHLEIVMALLANGPISEAYRNQAFDEATENGHIEIVHVLQQAQVVPDPIPDILVPEDDNTLNVHAGNRDQKVKASIINFYKYQGPISKLEIDSAFTSLLSRIDSEKEPLNSKALDALIGKKRLGESFGPFVDKDLTFTVLGHEVQPKEFIARLWIFANRLSNETDRPLAIQSIVCALAESFKEDGKRVCNQGKIQRLIVGVLQGRLASVNIEDHDLGIQEIDLDRADQLFFTKESRKQIKSLKALLTEASDFCKENPLVNKKAFLEHFTDENFLEMQGIVNDVYSDLKEFIDKL